MNRIGWTFLAVFALVVVLFASLVEFRVRDPDTDSPVPVMAPPQPAVAGMLTLPVRGVSWDAVANSWGDARGGGTRAHTGTDIMAPGGTPVVAAAPGTVEKLFFSGGGGGITAYVRSRDRRLVYYYAHLAGYAPGLREGQVLAGGDPIGFVGDTGNAGAGNTHLHFGIERVAPDGEWHEGEAVNPYPLLARGRAGG